MKDLPFQSTNQQCQSTEWKLRLLCHKWQGFCRCHESFVNEDLITSPAWAVVKYCDQHLCLSAYVCVCLSVCPPGYLRNHTCGIYQFFCACCLWLWLSPPAWWRNPKGKGQFWGFSSPLTPPPPQPFYGPFSGTTRVSRCQKRTSGLYGARRD